MFVCEIGFGFGGSFIFVSDMVLVSVLFCIINDIIIMKNVRLK